MFQQKSPIKLTQAGRRLVYNALNPEIKVRPYYYKKIEIIQRIDNASVYPEK
jgi:hypothetical protein